jgi:hypothetical protein
MMDVKSSLRLARKKKNKNQALIVHKDQREIDQTWISSTNSEKQQTVQ